MTRAEIKKYIAETGEPLVFKMLEEAVENDADDEEVRDILWAAMACASKWTYDLIAQNYIFTKPSRN